LRSGATGGGGLREEWAGASSPPPVPPRGACGRSGRGGAPLHLFPHEAPAGGVGGGELPSACSPTRRLREEWAGASSPPPVPPRGACGRSGRGRAPLRLFPHEAPAGGVGGGCSFAVFSARQKSYYHRCASDAPRSITLETPTGRGASPAAPPAPPPAQPSESRERGSRDECGTKISRERGMVIRL